MESTPDYGSFIERPTDDKFAKLAELVKKQRDAEVTVAEAEANLKRAQEELRLVREVELPEFLENELGLREVRLRDGTRDGTLVKVKETVRAGISKERAARAFRWLREEAKAPHLIKHVLKIELAKGEDSKAAKVAEALQKAGLGVELEDNESVHASTLSAWVREQLEAGQLPDEAIELLGVHRQKFAEIA